MTLEERFENKKKKFADKNIPISDEELWERVITDAVLWRSNKNKPITYNAFVTDHPEAKNLIKKLFGNWEKVLNCSAVSVKKYPKSMEMIEPTVFPKKIIAEQTILKARKHTTPEKVNKIASRLVENFVLKKERFQFGRRDVRHIMMEEGIKGDQDQYMTILKSEGFIEPAQRKWGKVISGKYLVTRKAVRLHRMGELKE